MLDEIDDSMIMISTTDV